MTLVNFYGSMVVDDHDEDNVFIVSKVHLCNS